MRIPRKAIVAVGVVGVAAGGSAVAMASTDHAKPSTKNGPHPPHARGHDRAAGLDAGTRAVVESIRKAVLDGAPAIVGPVLDQAVTDGKLTAAQAATAKQALTDLQAGKRPSADALALLRDAGARDALQSAVTAVAKQTPAVAAPIISAAVTAKTITQAQADQLTARIAAAASSTRGFGPFGFGFGGPGGPGGPGHPGGPGRPGAGPGAVSAAERAVLQDVATAVLKQASTVGDPIIASAVSAGTITAAQGDQLKAAAADVAAKGPTALAGHRDLLASAGVRTVVASIAQALSAKADAIGGPIVDQAVKDGKLTQAQGDALKQRLASGFGGFGPGGFGPGGPRGFGPGGPGGHPGWGGGRHHG
jgi:polyhydroxyalkanoate synthesis regulator phasin